MAIETIKHICPKCGALKDTEKAALHCCPIDTQSMYTCEQCGQEFDDEEDADECCSGDEDDEEETEA